MHGHAQTCLGEVLGFSTAFAHRCSAQVHLVEPRFNRLTVFDGRYPHGVRPVEGTRDPLKARLVLHGWFTDPTPFFEGERPLTLEQASAHELALTSLLITGYTCEVFAYAAPGMSVNACE